MKRLFFLLLVLILLAGCAAQGGNPPAASGTEPVSSAPSATETPQTETETPETEAMQTETEPAGTEPPLAPGVACEEPELTDAGVFVSLYSWWDASELQWSYRFDDVRQIEYDPYEAPVRFDGDKSVWTTYERDGDSDNCLMGRCVSSRAEWDYLTRVLFSADYQADPEAAADFGTPVFILRQGADCKERTTRIPVGQTGYIDDELCRYYVSPDGTVLRCDADGSVFRAVTPLEPEAVARLYLIYETAYRAWPIRCPCIYRLDEPDEQEPVLLVRTADRELRVPKEKWSDFLALVSVEADKEIPSDLPCFRVLTQLYAAEAYPSPELLRFTFYTEDYDPDSPGWQQHWCSLREDGRIILEAPYGAGGVYTVAHWNVRSPVRYVSMAVFDTEAITRLIFGE